MPTYYFFFQADSPFSNFYTSNYQINGFQYFCSEQGFMHQKALFFGDKAIAEQILMANTPKLAKAFGRKVKNFNEEKWDKVKCDIMYRNVFEKFRQNKNILDKMLSVKEDHFVEASPYDFIWGIGLDQNSASRIGAESWKGKNLLGKTLDKVRLNLRNEVV